MPVYGRFAVSDEKIVGFGKMFTPEKAVVRRQRAGVGAFQYEVAVCVDEFFLAASVAAPKYKHHRFFACGQNFNNLVGELLPAAAAV